jgi:uncharacterized membrane protein
VNTFSPVREIQHVVIQHVGFLGHSRIGRRIGHQFSRVNTRCPVRRPVRVRLIAVSQTIDSQPIGIQILLNYTRTDVTC